MKFWKLFKKREKPCTLERAAEIRAQVQMEIAEEDRLIDEWFDGPGKDWPRHVEMHQEFTCGPFREMNMLDAGWEGEVMKYVQERKRPG